MGKRINKDLREFDKLHERIEKEENLRRIIREQKAKEAYDSLSDLIEEAIFYQLRTYFIEHGASALEEKFYALYMEGKIEGESPEEFAVRYLLDC